MFRRPPVVSCDVNGPQNESPPPGMYKIYSSQIYCIILKSADIDLT